jgi:nucleoid-associated protein YgaU
MYEAGSDVVVLRSRRPQARWPAAARRPVVRRTLAGVLVGGLLLLGLARAVQGSPASAYERVTVRPGDTLWAIAADRYPNADVRDKVDQIERANGLGSPDIRPGQTLRVPSN